MSKVTIDKETFKALASDTRLEILKALDGRKMNLSELSRKTGLSKTTILEHLNKLVEADLVKKIEREGHKWTYYKLSWKGSSLLHPENTKIVIVFCVSIFFLLGGVYQIAIYGIGSSFTTAMDLDGLNLLGGKGNFSSEDFQELMIKHAKEEARNKTLLGAQPGNVHVYQSTENLSKGLKLEVFYQDPSYLYLGISFLTISIATLFYLFRTLRRRKSILDMM